ncbi:hypothetical protein [Rahnella rivi]|uniref:hypothetical protein n=1 Tax=Rahnella rivi TaxID=2816249 RepID=UPI001EE55B1D|nr:hypothetical protein [Rahnella rivi]
MTLSQLTLRFPKKLIESLKNRAVTEKTSVNALAERFLDVSLQTRPTATPAQRNLSGGQYWKRC